MSCTDNTYKKAVGSLAYALRPTASSQVKNGREKKSRGRNHLVSPTACLSMTLCYAISSFISCQRPPQKGHSTALGNTKRINTCITRMKAPPSSELHCRASHTNPFLIFYSSLLLKLAPIIKLSYLFSRVNYSPPACSPRLHRHFPIHFLINLLVELLTLLFDSL